MGTIDARAFYASFPVEVTQETKSDDPRPIYCAAIDRWGRDAQTNQAIEECAELILALRHQTRGKADDDAVAQEVADVEIMCSQLREMLPSGLVDRWKLFKIHRLRKILGM